MEYSIIRKEGWILELGENIKAARKRMGLTQEELASQIGVTAQAVSRWESEAGLPDISMIVPLARVLSVSTDTLFGMEKMPQDETEYMDIRDYMEKIRHESASPKESALRECKYLLGKLEGQPVRYVLSCMYVEAAANLSRYVDFNGYAYEDWEKIRDIAIRYGTQVIRFCDQKEWIERTHFALAWIYIHEKDVVSAREHIDMLPSVATNRLQESILAQLASFENGVDAMKDVLRKNLQYFTRALNKEILYAMEDFSWNADPEEAVAFGEWGLDVIHTLSKNADMISFCRGFTRDLYKYIMQADLRAGKSQDAERHFKELKEAMSFHYQHYQKILESETESAKYEPRNLRNMKVYTKAFMEDKQREILVYLKECQGWDGSHLL